MQPTLQLITEDPRLAASVQHNATLITELQWEKAQRETAYRAWSENVRLVDELLKRQSA